MGSRENLVILSCTLDWDVELRRILEIPNEFMGIKSTENVYLTSLVELREPVTCRDEMIVKDV
jgi:hypothetical protein